MTTDYTELKPCPFCAGAAAWDENGVRMGCGEIACEKCGASMRQWADPDNEKTVTARWNLRAAASAPRAELTDEKIDAITQAHGTGGWQTVATMRIFARSIERAVLAQAAPVAASGPIMAWASNDGRVQPASAMDTARRVGGATASAMEPYTIPLAPVAAAVPAGWVKNTGEQPVANGVLVEVEFRNGEFGGRQLDLSAECFRWNLSPSTDRYEDRAFDIINWRLAAPAPVDGDAA